MNKVARHIALAALLTCPFAADAQAAATCTVSPPAIAFGAYDPLSSTDLRTQGAIAISCSHGNPQVRISIGPGQSGSIAQRELRRAGGGTPLRYNLYKDAALAAIWGTGTEGLSLKAKDGAVIYGRIAAAQSSVEPGAYSDTLVVTIEW